MREKNKAKNDNASQDKTLKIALPKKRKIFLFGNVNEACAKRVIEELNIFNKENAHKKILLLINSTGGEEDSGSNIAEAIYASKAPVYGMVLRSACSAAFDVLQACKKRIACSKKSIIMCHAPNLADIRVDQTDRDEIIKKRAKAHNDFLRIVVARSGGRLALKKMHELSKKEVDIPACYARRLGLLDRVCYKKKKKRFNHKQFQ